MTSQPIMSEKTSLPTTKGSSLLPSPSPAPAPRKRSLLTLPRLAALASLAIYLSLTYTGVLSLSSDPEVSLANASVGEQCFQPVSPKLGKDELKRSDVFWTDEFKKVEVERFLGAIRVPTETFDDMAHAPVDGPDYDSRWNPFIEFHAYLEKTFPLVHEKATLEKTNRFSLIYTLEGSKPELKPLVLTAHQDVVPAQTSLDRWTYPPFTGVFSNGTIYGRGSTDCKNSLIGILSVLEHLISTGWQGKRTVTLAFGFDEEIGGPQGAFSIGPKLLEKFGKDGVAMLIDEGGSGVSREYGKTLILPGTGEKGMLSPTILVETAGGHSSTPMEHTSIGLLSRIVVAVEDALLFPPTLTPASPIFGYLTCVATHGKPSLVPQWLKDGLKGKLTQKKLDKLAGAYASVAGRMNGEFLVRTSKAATLLSGGHKVNALPESASVVFNSRIDFASNPNKTLDLYAQPILPIAKKFNLTFVSHDGATVYTGAPGAGKITLGAQPDSLSPAPVTPLRGSAFEVFLSASRRVYEKPGEGEVIVAPSAATGNTDTKHYWDLTKNIYRFVPRRVGTSFNAHTVDESILLDTHLEGIEWFHELILFFDEIKGDDGF